MITIANRIFRFIRNLKGSNKMVIYNSVDLLRESGFCGFVKIGELMNDCSEMPDERGVYLVLNTSGGYPTFVEKGSGGYFKDKNPNVSIEELNSKWVENTIVLYIGHVGGVQGGRWSNNTLCDRIKKYMRFGKGHNVAHYGGRYIWQIKDYKNLIVCWKPLKGRREDPKKVESEMINQFVNIYGKRPFANLIG